MSSSPEPHGAEEASWLSDAVLDPRLVAVHGSVSGDEVLDFAYDNATLALGASALLSRPVPARSPPSPKSEVDASPL